jgi:predicted phosphodiesterase
MSKVTLVWRTDVHMADHGPSSRTDDWRSMVLDKLGQVRDFAAQEGASAILDGGDFFHIKSPGRNTHETLRMVADHHTAYPFPVYCVPGNHDCVYGNYQFLGQQPLGVLYSTGIFKRLYDEHEVVFLSGTADPLDFSEQVKVRVVGIPFHGNRYDMDRFFSIEKGDEDYLVCCAHVLASRHGGNMFEGEDIVRYNDLLDAAPDVFCFGHWHKDQGVEVIEGKHFVNVGSLTRGSLSQDEVQRQPACVALRFTPKGIEAHIHRLDVRPAHEVFDVERRRLQVERQVNMDGFVASLRDGLKQTEGTPEDKIRMLDETLSDVRERALRYYEEAGE